MIRVLVVARSPQTRTRLEASLARRADLLVAGTGDWLPTDALAEREPDVVVLVLDEGDVPRPEPGPGGLGAARLVVLGPDPIEQWAPATLRLGARGVLPVEVSSTELGAAIDVVFAGLAVVPPSLAGGMRPRARRRIGGGGPPQPLTPVAYQLRASRDEGPWQGDYGKNKIDVERWLFNEYRDNGFPATVMSFSF